MVTDAAPLLAERRGRILTVLSQTIVLVGFASAAVTIALVVHARVWPELVPVLLPVPWLVAAAWPSAPDPTTGGLLFLGLGYAT